jgi:hypothetical protein
MVIMAAEAFTMTGRELVGPDATIPDNATMRRTLNLTLKTTLCRRWTGTLRHIDFATISDAAHVQASFPGYTRRSHLMQSVTPPYRLTFPSQLLTNPLTLLTVLPVPLTQPLSSRLPYKLVLVHPFLRCSRVTVRFTPVQIE